MGGVADAVGGLAGGFLGFGGADAAKQGSAAQVEALKKAIEEYRAGYAGQENLWNPLRGFGMSAIGGLNALNSGDYSAFENSPDYQFALQQGNQALGQNQASRGNLFSGGAGQEIAKYNQGLATQNLGNYRNSLFNTLNYGQNATGALSNALENKTQGIADARIGAGNARASGYVGAANSYGNAASNLLNFVGGMWGGGGAATPSGSGYPQLTPEPMGSYTGTFGSY